MNKKLCYLINKSKESLQSSMETKDDFFAVAFSENLCY